MRRGYARRHRGLILWQTTLAFSSYVSAAGVLSDVIGAQWAALILVITGGLTQATGVYIAALSGQPPEGRPSGAHARRSVPRDVP
jgi:hypothetical protein